MVTKEEIGEGLKTETKTGEEVKPGEGKEAKLDPLKISQATIEQTAAFKGLASEKNQLRQERAALQTQLAVAQQQIQTAKDEYQNKLEMEDSDFPELETAEDAEAAIKENRKEVKALKKEISDIKKGFAEERKTQQMRSSDDSVNKAREKYSEKTVGAEMAWDKVIDVGLPDVVKEYGRDFVGTLSGGALYKLCLITSPELIEKTSAIQKAATIDQFKKGGTSPQRGGGTSPVITNVKTLSKSELDQKLNELEDRE